MGMVKRWFLAGRNHQEHQGGRIFLGSFETLPETMGIWQQVLGPNILPIFMSQLELLSLSSHMIETGWNRFHSKTQPSSNIPRELRGFREDAVCPDVVAHTQVRRPRDAAGMRVLLGGWSNPTKIVVNYFLIFLFSFWVLITIFKTVFLLIWGPWSFAQMMDRMNRKCRCIRCRKKSGSKKCFKGTFLRNP